MVEPAILFRADWEASLSLLALFALAISISLVGVHVGTCLMAGLRLRTGLSGRATDEPKTVVISVAGLDDFETTTAMSALALAGPSVEILYCGYEETEPAVVALRRRLARSPMENVHILVGRSRKSRNPKLDNLEKAFDAVRTELVVFVDGNVRLPPDFAALLLDEWDDRSGAVSSPPLATSPMGFWAEVECAMLNTLFARYQVAAAVLGGGFVHGKVFMIRKSFLAARGGMRALDGEPIEDGAATRLVRAAGKTIRLTRRLFEQPLGVRRFRDVWHRNLRWAQQRRHCYPVVFILEPLITGIPALATMACASIWLGLPALPLTAATAIAWYGSEAALARSLGWFWNVRFFVVAPARDALAIAVWLVAWFRTQYVWRGQPVDLSADTQVR